MFLTSCISLIRFFYVVQYIFILSFIKVLTIFWGQIYSYVFQKVGFFLLHFSVVYCWYIESYYFWPVNHIPNHFKKCYEGLPWWLSGKESAYQCRRHRFDPWSRDPTCCRATKFMCFNHWAYAQEPGSHNYWVHKPQLLKPVCPRAHGRQQEKPPQCEAHALQLESSPCSLQLEKKPSQQWRPSTAMNK